MPNKNEDSSQSSGSEKLIPKSRSSDHFYDYLIWTGPRATDITDCEKGLFDGSITLYGQFSKDAKPWSLDSIECFIDGNLGNLDEEGRIEVPNSCFCDSPFNLNENGKRVNHNRSDLKEGDLFVLAEQIRLIKKVWKSDNPVNSNQKNHDRIWFMAYNQNFVGRHGDEEQYMLLAGILALDEMCTKDDQAQLFGKLIDIEKCTGDKLQTLKEAKELGRTNADYSDHLMNIALDQGTDDDIDNASIDFLTFWIKTSKIGRYDLISLDAGRNGFCESIIADWMVNFNDGITRKAIVLMKKMKEKGYLENLKESVKALAGEGCLIHQMKVISEIIVQCAVCLNPNETMMGTLDSKNKFRDLCIRHQIPTTENIVVEENGDNCSLSRFSDYRRCHSFVIQKTHSSGGYGTYVYNMPSEDKSDDEKRIEEEETNARIRNDLRMCSKGDLILSEYRDPSISVNVHCVLSENETLISPASVQIIVNIGGRLMYSGADFIAYQKFAESNSEAHHMLMMYCEWLCGTLSKNGYRGIIGFDVLISKEYGIEFVEANNRFQASTCLLNKALRNLMFKKKNGHLARRYDGKPITGGYRYPSVQLMNLMAFYGSEAYRYDGEEDKSNSKRKEILNWMILEYGKRLCPHSLETTICSDGKRKGKETNEIHIHSPMLPSEFKNIPIPYSMIIYYNNQNNLVSGFEHYKHIRECVSLIENESEAKYQMACIKERYRLAEQTGVLMNKAIGEGPELVSSLRKYIPTLDPKYSMDGLMAGHTSSAKTLANRIGGLFLNNGYKSDIPELCDDIIGGISAIGAWRFGICLDAITFFCDRIRLKGITSGDAPDPNWLAKELDLWDRMYDHREKHLCGNGGLPHPTKNPEELFKNAKKLIEDLDKDLKKIFECANSALSNNDKEEEIREITERVDKKLHGMLQDIKGFETEEIRYSRNKFKDFQTIQFEDAVDGVKIPNGKEDDAIYIKWKDDKANDGLTYTGRFLEEFYSMVTEKPVSIEKPCREYRGDELPSNIDNSSFDENAFISKMMFYKNICSTNLERVVIHPNLIPPLDNWDEKILDGNGANLLALKIGLINNGIRLAKDVSTTWDAKPGVNSSVDLNLLYGNTEAGEDILPINCAYNNDIAIFSPYTLEKSETEGSYTLWYYNKIVKVSKATGPSDAILRKYSEKQDIVGVTKSHGIPLSSIAFLATDRIRYQHNDGCMFNARGKGCKFCEFTAQIPGSKCTKFDEIDIMEAISATLDMRDDPNKPERHFKHILIGGGTLDNNLHKATNRVIAMIDRIRGVWIEKNAFEAKEVIRNTLQDEDDEAVDEAIKQVEKILAVNNEKTVAAVISLVKEKLEGKDNETVNSTLGKLEEILVPRIYLMCVPPEDLDDLEKLKSSGVTEISFNMETYSRTIARKIMPGKSGISRSTYIAALTHAVRIWENPSKGSNGGSVRSALILGLEPIESMQEGIRMLTSLGASPILSIFRPVRGTELEWIMPLSSPELYEIYSQASRTCREAGLRLGPSCIYCQNNTLSIPDEIDPFYKEVRL